MAVGMKEFTGYFAVNIFINLINLIIPLWRLYILRHRKRSQLDLAAEFLYSFAWVLNLAIHIRQTITDNQERLNRLSSTSDIEVLFKTVSDSYFQFELFDEIAQPTQLWCIKAAFLCFYWSLTARGYQPSLKLRVVLYVTAFVLVASYVVIIIVFFTYCKPISSNWDTLGYLTGNGKYCSPYVAYMPQRLWLSLTVITDAMVLGIPIMLVGTIKQNLSRVELRVLPLIFLIGALSIAASLARFFVNDVNGLYTNGIVKTTAAQFHLIATLSNVETTAAFIAFALPAFRLLLSSAFWRRKRGAALEGLRWKQERREVRTESVLLRTNTGEESGLGGGDGTSTRQKTDFSHDDVELAYLP